MIQLDNTILLDMFITGFPIHITTLPLLQYAIEPLFKLQPTSKHTKMNQKKNKKKVNQTVDLFRY